MLPGSTVPAMSREVKDTLAFLKSLPKFTFPAMEVMPKRAVPASNVEMLEVADAMKTLSTTSVTAKAVNVVTTNIKKVCNPPKKPVARKSWTRKGGENKVAK